MDYGSPTTLIRKLILEIQNPKWTEHQVEVKVLEMMLWLMKERLDEITNIERDLKKTKCVRLVGNISWTKCCI